MNEHCLDLDILEGERGIISKTARMTGIKQGWLEQASTRDHSTDIPTPPADPGPWPPLSASISHSCYQNGATRTSLISSNVLPNPDPHMLFPVLATSSGPNVFFTSRGSLKMTNRHFVWKALWSFI